MPETPRLSNADLARYQEDVERILTHVEQLEGALQAYQARIGSIEREQRALVDLLWQFERSGELRRARTPLAQAALEIRLERYDIGKRHLTKADALPTVSEAVTHFRTAADEARDRPVASPEPSPEAPPIKNRAGALS